MDFAQYITQNALILIPALYVLGMIIKNTERIPNKDIPLILLAAGIAGTVGIMGFNVQAIVQGVLVTGASVYANQLFKQCNKKDE